MTDAWVEGEVARRGRVGSGNTVEIPTTLWNHMYDDYAANRLAAEATGRAAVRALAEIRAEVEPVRTRRVRRNGAIKARCDAVLATEIARQWLREEG